MNEIVSFSKEIEFKTMFNEITSISLEHTLIEIGDNKISGDLIVSGTYKQTEASQIENPFSYKVPVEIEIDKKYDLSDLIIDIDDFTYEEDGDNKLKINVDLKLDKLKLCEVRDEQDEIVNTEDLFMEEDTSKKLEIPVINDSCEKEVVQPEVKEKSLFSSLDNAEETYKTYSVYIMKENDSLESIMSSYKVNREVLEEYNNLNDLRNGSKIIIPNINE